MIGMGLLYMKNQLKITTWNVNGLRAALRNGIWDWIEANSPDVLCLQEIRVRSEQLTEAQLQLFIRGLSSYLESSRTTWVQRRSNIY